jgi:uncharacterized protein YbcI
MSAVIQRSSPSRMVVAAPVREPLLEISNRMVRLHKQALGRGPTKCRTHFPDPHSVVVLLEETLTVSERNLVAMGEFARLHEARVFAQSALEREARTIVEDVLRRPTVAFITGLDPRRDVVLHFFALAPADETAG